MNFTKFSQAIQTQFKYMNSYNLFVIDLPKDALWETYLSTFPEGTNPIYKERTQHDCNCCKNFIRDIGNVVAIIDNKIVTIWDEAAFSTSISETYQTVSKNLAELIRSTSIRSPYLRSSNYGRNIGARITTQLLESDEIISWNHFYCTVPNQFMSNNKATILGKIYTTIDIFKRGLKEISTDALISVKELIDQESLYRGEEFKTSVNNFIQLQKQYNESLNKEIFIWSNYNNPAARIRNTVIGSLLQDLSKDIDLNHAVTAFELKVAPSNYKRPKALITQGMIDQATKTITELGIEDSLHRRLAVLEDISVNNVIFVDRSVAPTMKDSSIAGLLSTSVKPSTKSFDKAESIHIDKFLTDVIPNIDSMEVMLDNKHTGNLVSLVAPKHPDSPNILQWGNNFSWAYNGDVTDSMKERVKGAGGKVDGVLRFSIQWNEGKQDDSNDLDAHCKSPLQHIYYSSPQCSISGGNLDVDITRPGTQTKDGIAVENITWPSLFRMKNGKYKFYVHNYAGTNKKGFRAEIEFNGEIYNFDYPNQVTSDIVVAVVTLKNQSFSINCRLPTSKTSKTVWNLPTQQFHKVSTICLSPNYWNDNAKGNKHFFFMLQSCNNPEETRSLYNEFLNSGLTTYRKVFEVLGSKLKCPPITNSLAGLGFSSTKKDELLVKVSGKFTRQLKIQF